MIFILKRTLFITFSAVDGSVKIRNCAQSVLSEAIRRVRVEKISRFLYANCFSIKGLCFVCRFFLAARAEVLYNAIMMIWLRSWGLIKSDAFGEKTMTKYYYKFWVPFVANKKRILLLAIASYIAMC